ncbi:unannotated protein [freshwater metagenome]|uniref:Unannotated protein n=1 Tax=freshwater metagenome TaxID=449393 RepID=A0A6J6EC80_9ZZZZ
MIRLCIDTSIGTSVAVTDGWVVRAEVNEFDSMRHAEVIGELIRDALALAGVTNTDIEAVVAGVGPGPFTGLRVGLAAASAFAVGAGVPLVSVASHDAIAVELAEDVFADEVEFIVTTDARRREIAWSRYTVLDPSAREALAFTRADGPQLARQTRRSFRTSRVSMPTMFLRLDSDFSPRLRPKTTWSFHRLSRCICARPTSRCQPARSG